MALHRRQAGRALLRVLAVWAVGSATLAVLAAALPDLTLRSARGDSPPAVALAAAAAAGAFGLLNAVVWPLLVRALLLVPAYVLGLLTFALNGALLLVAIGLVPSAGVAVAPQTAVVVAAVMSGTTSATSAWLALHDDDAYRHRLARLAGRGPGRGLGNAPAGAGPGTVVIQLDGVGHDVLRDALRVRPARNGVLRPPLMPTLTGWAATTHTLSRWHTDWSSQTGASQLGILHGTNHDVPAFRWYEKDTGQTMVCNRPSCAAELERRATRRTGRPGLLAGDAASRGNLFTGGADQLALVLSVAVHRDHGRRDRAGYFAYFADPAHLTRTVVGFTAEVAREITQSLRARLRRATPRIGRGGLYPVLRAFATVVERDVVVASVIGDILAGRPLVYADLVAYDEVAHHSGPRGHDTDQVLRRIDRALLLIAGAARHAPRPYRFVVLSDHGQSPGEPFAARYGTTLRDLVRARCGLAAEPPAGPVTEERESRAAARAALRRPERHPRRAGRGGEPVVLGSGNLGLISFPGLPGRADRRAVEERAPGLLRALADHPGIAFALVHDAERGPLVLGADGAEHELATGRVTGADPLAPFGPGAAAAVLRADGFPHAADIMVNSACDPDTGAVHAFEEQVGSHGGMGGPQSEPFILHPRELPVPSGGLTGAEAVHALLREWTTATGDAPGRPERVTEGAAE
ncbi:phage holin family protein [Streptantibioticus silvisoli]|uniref:Phage holin family protein n=1 Tax=Streptantibioticus silvisoli TaxID=2705255 RepID=A0ABT6W8Y7_9ACTN|nr:phage holin family protein [Streptantibioticus silvisoli]MDI5967227.1 phage holin family protein [Streptantibioticus silvisoli]